MYFLVSCRIGFCACSQPHSVSIGKLSSSHELAQRIHIIRELGLDIDDDCTELPEVDSNRLE